MSATIEIMKGHHHKPGWAVYATQEAHRCLLLETIHGRTVDEALWTAMSSWATFQPRHNMPRSELGQLYYPNESSHVFEKYWDFLPNLCDHPDFSNETPYCQELMTRFSAALSTMNLSEFEPHPAAEAKDTDVKIATEAAISRLLPIQGGDDQWEVHRSSAATESGGDAPG
jgi:hypothetical protein